MAGGYHLFSTGEVLTAANVDNYLMNQTVMVFANSSARTTALSGVLSAGMISYLTGTNSLETYNGTTWTANGTGDVTTTGTQTLTNKTLTLPIIDNLILGYATTVTAAGTTTLTSASVNQQLFTGTSTQTVVMPVSSTMTVGTRYLIENNSTGIVTVQSSGANTIVAVPSNVSVKVTAILNSGTTAASWDYEYVGFNTVTGTGSAVLATSPTLTSPLINLGINAQTGTTYTTVLGDNGQLITLNNASAITVSIPTNASVAYPIGTQLNFAWITGAGQPTIQAVTSGTTTILSTGATSAAPKLRVVNASATCVKILTDTWIVAGDIA